MLNPKARQLLRCTALTRSGSRCRAYIVGGLEVCIATHPGAHAVQALSVCRFAVVE